MLLTKEALEKIEDGEIFKVITTRLQNFDHPFTLTLKFVCVKSGSGRGDWAMYAGLPDWSDDEVKRMGDKVTSFQNIATLCPCDEQAYAAYRR